MRLLFAITFLLLSCGKEKEQRKVVNEVVQEVKKEEVKKVQENILNWEKYWVEGIGSVEGFKSFGKEGESRRIKGKGVDGEDTILWECIPDNETVWDGGFETSKLKIDPNYAYRYVVWLKKNGGNIGKAYYAVSGVEETTGEFVKNANFIASGSVFEKFNEWYVLVGYVYPKTHIDNIENDVVSGLYYNGIKVKEGRDFKWKDGVTEVSFWTLLNNCKDSLEERLYLCNPQLHKIDGTEPALDDII